jgi:hypothetical protein
MTEIVVSDLPRTSPTTRPLDGSSARLDRRAEISTAGVVEMLLKDTGRLNTLLRDEGNQRELVPRMLAVSVAGYAVYGVVATAILNALWMKSHFWFPHLPAAHWNDWSAANLLVGYTIGVIAAHGICLPSFYFYGLLSGIKTTMLGVTAHAVKSMAAAAVALVGLVPIYVALALASIIYPLDAPWNAVCVVLGLLLPFIAGLLGAANLYEGFVGLADTMTCPRPDARQCFLRRLILAWVACASFVTPVVVFSLWHFLGDLTQHFTLTF